MDAAPAVGKRRNNAEASESGGFLMRLSYMYSHYGNRKKETRR